MACPTCRSRAIRRITGMWLCLLRGHALSRLFALSSTRLFLSLRLRCRTSLRARARSCTMFSMEAKGVNGQVTLKDGLVTISRAGFFGWATQGKNTKQVPVSSIGSVQFRPPTLHTNGVWSISVAGEVQSSRSPRGLRDVTRAGKDENSVIVGRSQVKAFRALTEAINEARVSPGVPASAAPVPDDSREGVIAQLRQLGAMHHRGALDDATFIQELHTLLPQL